MRSIIGTSSSETLGRYLGCNVELDGCGSKTFASLAEKVQKKWGVGSTLLYLMLVALST